MSDQITIDYEALLILQQDLLVAASKLSEVAGGAYVAGDVFPESTGDATVKINGCMDTLARSATVMLELLTSGATYFGKIVEGFSQWDRQQASSLLEALEVYQHENRDNREAPVNQPPS